MCLKVICVDDETRQRRILENIIDWKQLGYELVASFASAEQALDYIKQNRVDVIISDIRMEGVSGIDLAKFCFYHYPNIKIIFISAFGEFEFAKEALKYNIFSYIIKPITKTEIDEALQKIYAELKNNTFAETGSRFKQIETQRMLFGELMLGNTNYASIEAQLTSINIDIDLDNSYVYLYKVSINEIDKYMNSVWYHGTEQLKVAVSQIIVPENIYSYCSMTRFRQDSFEIVVIEKKNVKRERLKVFLDEYMQNLKRQFLELLELDVEIELLYQSSSLKKIAVKDDEEVKNNSMAKQAVNYVVNYLNNNYSNQEITLNALSEMVGFSSTYLCEIFKKIIGKNIFDYLTEIRIDRAKKLLIQTDHKASTICNMIGYSYNSYFYKQFKSYTGYTPVEYRKIFK